MELRKSIEKAKQQRQGSMPSGEPAPPQTDPERGDEAWKAPVYSQSRNVKVNMKWAEKMRCVCLFPNMRESDYYNVLRSQIQNMAQDYGWRTIMITSTQPGEGKTLTSINLALSFSRAFNQTVLLVDCDLRRQSIYKYLGFQSQVGLINYLVDGMPLEETIMWPGVEKLSIISGGQDVNSSSELMGSPRMKNAVGEMRSRYPDRYVLFDSPPIMAGADAISFISHVDCVVMVVEAGKTAKESIHKALEFIPEEKFVGFVLNRQKVSPRSYYNYYGYAYGRKDRTDN